MDFPEVSVVIPVYNGGQYIKECLESVLNQTLSHMEIVVVQHDSKDDTEKILLEMKKMYPALRVISRNGLKLSEARNLGMEAASGTYIGFIDADDYIEKDMYEKLYLQACKSGADMVICDYQMTYTDREEKSILKMQDQVIDAAAIGSDRLYVEYLAGNPCLWNKIYRAEIIRENGILFEIENGEDLLFNMRVLPYLKRISTIHDCCYHYRQRRGSLIHESMAKYSKDSMNLLDAYLKRPIQRDGEQSLLEYYAFANMITGLMFSSSCVRRGLSFYRNQLSYMRTSPFFEKFCHRIAWTNDLRLLYEKRAMSIRFYGFQRLVFGLCTLRWDGLAAVVMFLAGKLIEAKYQSEKASYFD